MNRLSNFLTTTFTLSLLATTANAGTYSGGSGIEADPYKISTIADWQELIATQADWSQDFILLNDIDLSGVSVTPVGSFSAWFTGVFEGNGHIIHNLEINLPTSSSVGLFGFLGYGGQIRNIGVNNVSLAGEQGVAGLCGSNYEGSISNSFVTGSVTGNTEVGGLCGSNLFGTIIGCYAAVSLKGGSSWLGGLCGYNNYGSISSCYGMGSVSGGDGSDYLGGLCGYNNYGSINRCFAAGSVFGENHLGGLVGMSLGMGEQWGCRWICDEWMCWEECGPEYVEMETPWLVENSFWDTETSGLMSSSGGTGKTTAEMQILSTFTDAGWDFVGEIANGSEDTWKIPIEGYPILSWQTEEVIVIPELIFNLAPSHMSGLQWTRVTFRGELINMGAERVYINGVSFTEPDATVSINNDIFMESGPAFLDPNESWTGDLFDIYMDIATPLGNHFGTITILGGRNVTSGIALATQSFQLTIQPLMDFNQNGVIDLPDLGFFAESWMADPCSEENSWCNDRDIDHFGTVNLEDFQILAEAWLKSQ